MEEHDGPKKPWWDEDGLTMNQFLAKIDELRKRQYSHDDVEYTHDIFFHETLIGEAACVEEVGHGLFIGVASYGGMDPSYEVFDSRLTLLPKRLTRGY